MSLSWVLALVDKMSPAAKSMVSSLATVDAALQKTDKETEKLHAAIDKGFGTGKVGSFAKDVSRFIGADASKSLASLAATMKSVGDGTVSLEQAGGGARMMGEAAVGAAGGVVMLTAAVMAAAAAAAGGLAIAGTLYAAEMADFKENTLFALTYATGASETADRVFRSADALAARMGAKTTDVAGTIQQLIAHNMGYEQAEAITAAVNDMKAMNPGANTANLITQLERMQTMGKMDPRELKAFLNAGGVKEELFFKALQNELGGEKKVGNLDALKKMVAAGTVDSDAGTKALLQAVYEQGGNRGLGAIAQDKATTTVGGSFGAVKASIERLFLGIESGPVGAVLVKLGNAINKALDPAGGGGKIIEIFNKMATLGGGILDKILGDGSGVAPLLDMVIGFFDFVMPIVSALSSGFMTGFGEAFSVIASVFPKMSDGASKGEALTGAFKMIGTALGYIVVGIAVAIGAVVAIGLAIEGFVVAAVVGVGYAAVKIVDGIVWLVGAVAGAAGAIWDGIGNIGGDLITGIVDGITNNAVALFEAVTNLGAKAIAILKAVFKIKSPSRVMMEIGADVTEGFAQGVASNDNADRAVRSMVDVRDVQKVGGSTTHGSGNTITINVNGAKDPKATAAEIRREVMSIFDDVAFETGALAA